MASSSITRSAVVYTTLNATQKYSISMVQQPQVSAKSMHDFYGSLLRFTDQKVTLLHESARDYLLQRQGNEDGLDKGLHIDLEEMHLRITKTCIDALVRKHPLTCYAMQYWRYHAKHSGTLGSFLYYTSALFGTHSGTRDL